MKTPGLICAIAVTWLLAETGGIAHADASGPAASPTAALSAALVAEDFRVRRNAARQALRMGPEALDALPALLTAYDTDDTSTRRYVIRAIERMGPDAAAAAPTVRRALLEDPVTTIRAHAATTLGALGVTSADVVSALAQAAQVEANAANRRDALLALGALGPGAHGARDAAAAALANDPVHYVRSAGAQALGGMWPASEPDLPVLFAGLHDPNPRVRNIVAGVLAGLGPHAPEIRPELDRVVEEYAGTGPAFSAARALAQMDDGTSTPDPEPAPEVATPGPTPEPTAGDGARTADLERLGQRPIRDDEPVVDTDFAEAFKVPQGDPAHDDSWSTSCQSPTVIGTVGAGMSHLMNGKFVRPHSVRWFQVSFPVSSRRNEPQPGTPRIELDINEYSAYRFDLYRHCTTPLFYCEGEQARELTSWQHDDSDSGYRTPDHGWVRKCPYPQTVLIRVYRTLPDVDAQYRLRVSNQY